MYESDWRQLEASRLVMALLTSRRLAAAARFELAGKMDCRASCSLAAVANKKTQE